jgi:hypothetical protein
MRVTRIGLAAFAAGLGLFAVGEAVTGAETRASQNFQRFAEEAAAGRFLVGHAILFVAFALLLVGAFALYAQLAGGPGAGAALAGLLASAAGLITLLGLFGAAVLVYPKAAGLYLEGNAGMQPLLTDIDAMIWLAIVAVAAVVAGALLFAVAMWRSPRAPRFGGITYAGSIAAFLTLETASDPARFALAAVVVAVAAWLGIALLAGERSRGAAPGSSPAVPDPTA